MPNFSPLAKPWKDAMLNGTAFASVQVRTHYRSTIGPRHSMTIVEEPLFDVSHDWRALAEIDSAARNKALVHHSVIQNGLTRPVDG